MTVLPFSIDVKPLRRIITGPPRGNQIRPRWRRLASAQSCSGLGRLPDTAQHMPMDDLEHLPRAYGREIFARLDRVGPPVFSPAWWDERLMEWTMQDEAIKLQLFRFIDVL